jgi:anti-sigma factor RsiW
MRDCSKAEMRDLLPDLLHGGLPEDRRVQVQAHVDGCPDCRAELELLDRIRRTVATPTLDTARIVASLPAYRQPRRAFVPAAVWRIAAAVVLLAGGVTVLNRSAAPGDVPIADTIARVAAGRPAELSPGASIQDVSDSELRALVEVIDTLDAMLPVEPERIAVPIAPSEGL